MDSSQKLEWQKITKNINLNTEVKNLRQPLKEKSRELSPSQIRIASLDSLLKSANAECERLSSLLKYIEELLEKNKSSYDSNLAEAIEELKKERSKTIQLSEEIEKHKEGLNVHDEGYNKHLEKSYTPLYNMNGQILHVKN